MLTRPGGDFTLPTAPFPPSPCGRCCWWWGRWAWGGEGVSTVSSSSPMTVGVGLTRPPTTAVVPVPPPLAPSGGDGAPLLCPPPGDPRPPLLPLLWITGKARPGSPDERPGWIGTHTKQEQEHMGEGSSSSVTQPCPIVHRYATSEVQQAHMRGASQGWCWGGGGLVTRIQACMDSDRSVARGSPVGIEEVRSQCCSLP